MTKLTENLRHLGTRQFDEIGVGRLLRASGLLLSIFLVGTLGYWIGTDFEYSLLDCAFMTTITLTTVGYGEVIPVSGNPGLEVFTVLLIVTGMGIMLFFASTLTAFIIEGEFRDLLQIRRMKKRIEQLDNHFIVAGVGKTGAHVIREILESQRPVIVVELDRDRVQHELDHAPRDFPYIIGDATQDEILQEAGIERAQSLITSLGNDRDNLFVTITARELNEDLRIIARGEDPDAEDKFRRAGATSVIYTNVLGGLRMASEAIRPEVTTFLDLMMRDHEHYRRVEELPVPDDSPLIGQTIRDAGIRQYSDALVIAVYDADEDDYVFSPGPDHVIVRGSKLIVLTLMDDIPRLERLIRRGQP